jgi:hypothetical protein
MSCLAAEKNMVAGALGDGYCGPSKEGPNSACPSQQAFTCGLNGRCDGKGACEFQPNGTTCDTCANGQHATGSCSGPNNCNAQSAQWEDCSPYRCADTYKCATTCNSDSECVNDAFCKLPEKQCIKDLVNGAACTLASQCSSGFCVEGLCCDVACTDTCKACSSKAKGSGADGTCDFVTAGTDPKDACKDDGSPSCLHNGLCDGQGQCQSYAPGPCAPKGCTKNEQCASGFCVDGICCDKQCDGPCEACSVAMKGQGTDGLCENIGADRDPKNKCETSTQDCQADGFCDGSGQCRAYAKAGKGCGSMLCTDTIALVGSCDGQGTCQQSNVNCAPYACLGNLCATSCSTNAQCSAHYHCENSACVQDYANGTSCKDGEQCASGKCIDTVCCDSDCEGQCEACNLASSLGTCSPVSGKPAGNRPSCESKADAGVCGQEICDGKSTASCVFVGADVQCRQESCQNGLHTFPAFCDGKSNCGPEETAKCGAFACGTDAHCKTKCASNDDCALKYKCELSSGNCVPRGTECEGDHILVSPDGTATDCAPYRCESNTCKAACTSGADCVSGNQCDNGACVNLTGTDTPSDSGCGCRVDGTDRSRGAYRRPALMLGGFFIRRARYRKLTARAPRHASS